MVVRGKAADVQRFVDTVRSEASCFDFEKITPMPPELREIKRDTTTSEGLTLLDPASAEADFRLYVWRVSKHDPRFGKIDRDAGPFPSREVARELLLTSEVPALKEILDQARLVLAAREKYGYGDGHDWAIANWGTPRNACDPYMFEPEIVGDETQIEPGFDTAWGWPLPIMEKIVSMFPELVFTMLADEECGCFYLNAKGVNGEFSIEAFNGYREDGPYDFGGADDADGEAAASQGTAPVESVAAALTSDEDGSGFTD
jgi:hypothetical protein